MHILYEDEYLLICEKPAGVSAQGGPDDMVSRASETLGRDCLPIHRLDRGTGGLLALAKTKEAAARLSALFRDRAVEKEYLAVVQGAPEPGEGEYRDLLYHDPAKNKSYVVRRMRRGVREAVLRYRVEARTEELSLVRVTLGTGRTHQIRVQFASRGMPLLGDRRYGGRPAGTVALWSCRLCFVHPFTGRPLEAVLPPPRVRPWTAFETE